MAYSLVDLLKTQSYFSLSFDRSHPIAFQQSFWKLIELLDKHEIPWFNGEPAGDHAMCQHLLGQLWQYDYQTVVLVFEVKERYLGWQVDEETDELTIMIEDVYGFRWDRLAVEADYAVEDFEEFQSGFVDASGLLAAFGK